MNKNSLDKIFNKVIDITYNKINPSNDITERPTIEVVQELPNVFGSYSQYMDIEGTPYSDEPINEEVKTRTFNVNVNTDDLKWHRDRENRLVEVIEGDNWFIQFDNELPKPLIPGKQYIIPEGVYHRVIKGDSSLKIKINVI